jgi:hypothetical protein
MYKYKFISVPKNFVSNINSGYQKVEDFMQKTVDDMVKQGWEFYRIDSVTVTEQPGCLQGLLGAKETFHDVNIICFRTVV